MKKFVIILSLIFLPVFFGFSQSVAGEEGCNEISAWLIYPDKETSPVVREMHCLKNKEFRLADSSGKTIASMPLPELRPGYEFSRGECRLNGIIRHDIIAVVKHGEDTEWSVDVINAWVADPLAKAFVPMPVKGLACLNIGYGI